MRLARLNAALFLCCLSFGFSSAQAADGIAAIEVNLVPPLPSPFSGGPSDFSNAYTGFGYGIGMNYLFGDSSLGLGVRYSKQGDGSLIPTTLRVYLGPRSPY